MKQTATAAGWYSGPVDQGFAVGWAVFCPHSALNLPIKAAECTINLPQLFVSE